MSGTIASGWATGDIVTASEFKKFVGAIYDTTLSAAAASIDITGIIAAYAHLQIILQARGDTAAASTAVGMRFNADSGSNYDSQGMTAVGASASESESFAASSLTLGNMPAGSAGASLFGQTVIGLANYAGTTANKTASWTNTYKTGTSTGNITLQLVSGFWRSSTAINRVTLTPAAGNFAIGTRLTIYVMGA